MFVSSSKCCNDCRNLYWAFSWKTVSSADWNGEPLDITFCNTWQPAATQSISPSFALLVVNALHQQTGATTELKIYFNSCSFSGLVEIPSSPRRAQNSAYEHTWILQYELL